MSEIVGTKLFQTLIFAEEFRMEVIRELVMIDENWRERFAGRYIVSENDAMPYTTIYFLRNSKDSSRLEYSYCTAYTFELTANSSYNISTYRIMCKSFEADPSFMTLVEKGRRFLSILPTIPEPQIRLSNLIQTPTDTKKIKKQLTGRLNFLELNVSEIEVNDAQ